MKCSGSLIPSRLVGPRAPYQGFIAGQNQTGYLCTMASGMLLHSGSTCLLRRAVKEPARCSSSPAAAAAQPAVCSVPAQTGNLRPCFQGQSLGSGRSARRQHAQRFSTVTVYAVKDGATLDRPLRVAVVGGGPGGASCANTLAESGIETFLFERKMDNCKVSLDLSCCDSLRLLGR